MEERYSRKATILTTNLDYNQWHNILANKDLVNAMLSYIRGNLSHAECDEKEWQK